VFFLDFDIDSDGPIITCSFLLFFLKNFLPSIEKISSGLSQLFFSSF